MGVHDVIAARASKGVGAVRTAVIVTLAGLLILSAWLAWQGKFPAGPQNSIWLPLCAGAGIALATIWLFAALAAGSLSLALPIVMSYPVTSLALGTFAGEVSFDAADYRRGSGTGRRGRGGEVRIGRRSGYQRRRAPSGAPLLWRDVAHRLCRGHIRRPALGNRLRSAGGYWLARIGGSLIVLPLLFSNAAELPRVVGRWLPALVVMGGLDVLAIVMINLAALTNYPEMALVAASSAGVISILLARVIFQEHIAVQRWIGIILHLSRDRRVDRRTADGAWPRDQTQPKHTSRHSTATVSSLSKTHSTRAQITAARDRFEPLFSGKFETGLYPDEWNWRRGRDREDLTRQICNAWKSDLTIASLVLRADVGRGGGGAPRLARRADRQDNVIWKPPGTRPLGFHQDDSYNAWIVPGEMLTCWMTLDDTKAHQGTIEYVRGSHRWEIAPPIQQFHAPDDPLADLARAARTADVGNYEIVPIEVAAGTALFHHGRTWHGSRDNRGDQPRRAIVSHCISSAAHFHPHELSYVYSR